MHKFSVFGLAAVAAAFAATPARAHVKWFVDFDYGTPPQSFEQVMTSPTVLGLLALSALTIASLVFVERRLEGLGGYIALNGWLSRRQDASLSVMRLAMSALLLVSWSSEAVLAPELESSSWLLVTAQFAVAICLLFSRTVGLGGFGLLLIFLGASAEFGLFHMLDYLHYLGISVYLMVSPSKRAAVRNVGLPALFATVGFSLMWLGCEKLFYPTWSLYLLEANPQLALGFPPDFFVQGAAFVEISLGFLLLIGLLERPLAVLITLVFFTTTLVFGKVEVIGHTPVHAALVVFLLHGAGGFYRPPIAIHSKIAARFAFSAVNFVVLTALFASAYAWTAHRQFEQAPDTAPTAPRMAPTPNADDADRHHHGPPFALDETAAPPRFVVFEVIEEAPGLYDLHVEIEPWTFTPEKNGEPTVANEGHGHVYVDERKVGRLYGHWFHLGHLEPGTRRITVTLNGSDHRDLTFGGDIIRGETTVEVPDGSSP
ncbi:MAG: DoxX family membrane protein [Acidobacteriota bacterium]